MPPAPTAPPAAPAAPAGVNIVPPLSPPKPPPAPTREIRLSAPSDPGPAGTAIPPKPGSARERISSALRAKAGVEPAATPTPPAPAPATPTPPAAPEAPEAPAEGTPKPEGVTPAAATPTPPADPAKTGKTNPWKIVDQYKARTAELEKKLAESAAIPEQKQKEYLTRIEELQKHNERLENEIRFVNYSESKEFKDKFDAPYQAAWTRALSELNEIDITDPNTQATRKATANDLADLLAVPLTKARELADQYFGAFADDIMAYRKEIKGLFEARAAALKEAKEQGATRDKEQRELIGKRQKEMAEFIGQAWERSNLELQKHEKFGKYFTPVEGDQDGNQRLAKGFELVDRAFSEFSVVNDPNLTPDQRASIVKRHAAVRNRAAAFGRLLSMNQKLEAEKAALAKELEQYKTSTPSSAPTAPSGEATPGTGTAHERIFGELRRRAR